MSKNEINNFWNDLERFLAVDIPSDLIKILTANGYDNALSLDGMDLEEVDRIERFTNERLHDLLTETNQYSGMNPFSFLPGHRKLILILGEKSKEFKSPSTSKMGKWNGLSLDECSNVMKELINTMGKNVDASSTNRRYSETIQWFAIYIFILSGKRAYEVLSKNLPIPQVPTIMNYILQRKNKLVEGELRCKKLAEYLHNLNAPKKVLISEDGSGIVTKVSYDPSTNQVVGLVLPTDHTCMPISYSFCPETINDIEQCIKQNAKSTLVYLILAQPLIESVPPFILQCFGTDNSFKTEDVLLRWKQTKDQLAMHDIEVTGISTDGDARMLSSMKKSLNAICNQLSPDVLFNLNLEQSISYIQDPVHLATKLRNRLLKWSILLPMGNCQVSVTHLKILIKTVRKETHGLVFSHICPDDRQNFSSFEKITSGRVLNALEKYVPQCEATIKYLKLSRDITEAFTNVDLSPLERVNLVWKSLYFVRAWRQWLSSYGCVKYNLEDNFISQNAFTCLELNAYGLLHLIKKFRESNQSHLFLITLFNSQICESSFRQLRSITTANWTKINFSMLELLHALSRIELQNEIAYFRLSDKAILPRVQNCCGKHKKYNMPSDEDLRETLKQSMQEALLDAAKFKMEISEEQIQRCEINKTNFSFTKLIEPEPRDETNMADIAESVMDFTFFRGYSKGETEIDSNSRFFEVCDEDGSTKLIRKSAVVNMLADTPISLSKDRLERVKLPKETTMNKRKNQKHDDALIIKHFPQCGLRIMNRIEVGEWCIFKNSGIEHCMFPENGFHKSIIIGCVLSFRYITGKTKKDKQYGLDIAPVSAEGTSNRGLEVLSVWHSLTNDLSLELLSGSSFFHNIDNYVATVDSPNVILNSENNQRLYKLSESIDELRKVIVELIS